MNETANKIKRDNYRAEKYIHMPKILKTIKSNLSKFLIKLTIDYHLLSFPKSGRTWLKVILNKYYSEKNNVPFEINLIGYRLKKIITFSKIPTILFTHFGSQANNTEFADFKKMKNKKVILLLRDPRDVVVSFYHQMTKRVGLVEYSISDFIRDPNYGIEKIIKYNNQVFQHSHIYKDFLIIRYEELKNDTYTEVKKIVDFLDEQLDSVALKKAIEFAEFENMKKMEKENSFKDKILTPGNVNDENSYKVRKGRVGSYLEELNEADIEYVDSAITTLNAIFTQYKR